MVTGARVNQQAIEELRKMGADDPEMEQLRFIPHESGFFFIEEVVRPHGSTILRIYKPVESLLREVDTRVMDIYPGASGPPPKRRQDRPKWEQAHRLAAARNTVADRWAGYLWPDIRPWISAALEDTGLVVHNPAVSFQYLTDCWEIAFPPVQNESLPAARVRQVVEHLDAECRQVGWRWPDKVENYRALLR